MASLLTSTTNIACGVEPISLSPPKYFSIFSICLFIRKISFFLRLRFSFETFLLSEFKKFKEFEIVDQFVSIPPNHRLLT